MFPKMSQGSVAGSLWIGVGDGSGIAEMRIEGKAGPKAFASSWSCKASGFYKTCNGILKEDSGLESDVF